MKPHTPQKHFRTPALLGTAVLFAATAFAGPYVTEPAPVVGKKAVVVPPIVEEYCPIQCLECGPWKFEVDWTYFHQSERDDTALFEQPNGDAFGGDEFDHGYDSGFEISVRRQIRECCALEFRYGYSEWDDSTGNQGVAEFFNEGNTDTFALGSTSGRASLESELHDFQVVLKCGINDRLIVDVGFRYMDFDDEFRNSFNTGETADWEAENRMIGGQISAHAILWKTERFKLTGDAVFGLFANETESSFRAIEGATTDSFGDDEGSTASTLIQLEMGAEYKLTQCVSLYGAYRVFWLNNLALGPEQVGETDDFAAIGEVGTDTNDDEDLFFHGFVLGARICF